MQSVTFVSSNEDKFRELQSILSSYGISVKFARLNLLEIQAESLEEIATEKARNAFARVKGPVIVEDDGLFVDFLKGFPGQYSSYVFRTIGNEGILKLLSGSGLKSASFRSIVAYYDGKTISLFKGEVSGRISERITEGGWGYDPIFLPAGSELTFAELKEEKSRHSHRSKALEKFATWLVQQ